MAATSGFQFNGGVLPSVDIDEKESKGKEDENDHQLHDATFFFTPSSS